MFKREERLGKFLGYSAHVGDILFFFGSRFLPRAHLKGTFPDFEFCFLKQVHGKTVVEGDPEKSPEADAQFSVQTRRAQVAQTADCVPILLAGKDRVCAVHSGWRGTSLNIVRETKSAFGQEPVLFAAIGPHILGKSFEVGRDVAETLVKAVPAGRSADSLIMPHPDPAKVFFDLTELIRLQIRDAFGEQVRILECLEDTLTSVQFHSFRRDREHAERQYSFVVINR